MASKNLRTTTQFREVRAQSGRISAEAYCTIHTLASGKDVFIGAPSMNELELAWQQLTDEPAFDRNLVQHVWITSIDRRKDAK